LLDGKLLALLNPVVLYEYDKLSGGSLSLEDCVLDGGDDIAEENPVGLSNERDLSKWRGGDPGL